MLLLDSLNLNLSKPELQTWTWAQPTGHVDSYFHAECSHTMATQLWWTKLFSLTGFILICWITFFPIFFCFYCLGWQKISMWSELHECSLRVVHYMRSVTGRQTGDGSRDRISQFATYRVCRLLFSREMQPYYGYTAVKTSSFCS